MGNFPGEIQGKIPISHSTGPLLGHPLLFPSETSIACSSSVGCRADFSPVLRGLRIAEIFGHSVSNMVQAPLHPLLGVRGHVAVVATGLSWAVSVGCATSRDTQGHEVLLASSSASSAPANFLSQECLCSAYLKHMMALQERKTASASSAAPLDL